MAVVSRRKTSPFLLPILPARGCRTRDRTDGGYGGGDGGKRRTGSRACEDAQSNWPKPTDRGPNGAELGAVVGSLRSKTQGLSGQLILRLGFCGVGWLGRINCYPILSEGSYRSFVDRFRSSLYLRDNFRSIWYLESANL